MLPSPCQSVSVSPSGEARAAPEVGARRSDILGAVAVHLPAAHPADLPTGEQVTAVGRPAGRPRPAAAEPARGWRRQRPECASQRDTSRRTGCPVASLETVRRPEEAQRDVGMAAERPRVICALIAGSQKRTNRSSPPEARIPSADQERSAHLVQVARNDALPRAVRWRRPTAAPAGSSPLPPAATCSCRPATTPRRSAGP